MHGRGDEAQEQFAWVAREIAEGGGDSSMCESNFVGDKSNHAIEDLDPEVRWNFDALQNRVGRLPLEPFADAIERDRKIAWWRDRSTCIFRSWLRSLS